jgi:hypothetical protein
MKFQAVREHFAEHRFHMVGCLLAALLVIAALVIGAPVLAIVGALLCGGMMVMMVWMMVGMAGHHRHGS